VSKAAVGRQTGASQFPATAGEGQNPKLETRNPKEIRKPKSELWPSLNPLGWPGWAAGMVAARVADLPDSLAQTRSQWQRFGFRISDFLRISSFGFAPQGLQYTAMRPNYASERLASAAIEKLVGKRNLFNHRP
jgi:hypothetical protein